MESAPFKATISDRLGRYLSLVEAPTYEHREEVIQEFIAGLDEEMRADAIVSRYTERSSAELGNGSCQFLER